MTATKTEPRQASAVPNKRKVLRWELIGFVAINVVAGFLHFVFELSNFSEPVAVFGSVNESTFEHLKLYFWPGLIFTLIQHAYMRDEVNNFWWGRGLALLVTPLTIIFAFYFYLGIVLPITGKGTLVFDIGTGVFGVAVGGFAAYRQLTAAPKSPKLRKIGFAIIGVLLVLMATSAWITPEFFLYEDFFGYEYTGQFGVLEDYTDYLVFEGR